MDNEIFYKNKILGKRTNLIKLANKIVQHPNSSLPEIRECINEFGNKFYKTIYYYLEENVVSWRDLLLIGRMFSVFFDYIDKEDDEAANLVCDISKRCLMCSYEKAPIKHRHEIAYAVFEISEKTFYKYNLKELRKVVKGNYYFSEDKNILNIPNDCGDTSTLYSKVVLLFLAKHLLCFENIKPNLIGINNEYISNTYKQLQKDISIFCSDDKTLRKYAISIINNSIEDIKYFDFIDYVNFDWEFDDDTLKFDDISMSIIYENIPDSIEEKVNNDWLEQLEKNDNSYNCYEDSYNGLGNYKGSYAQDVMGYSDDDIDTIFDGDPDAYWNID